MTSAESDALRIDHVAPTSEMRAELEAAGVALPAGEELTAFSSVWNTGLETARAKMGNDGFSWFMLFKEVDEDGSGFVTYDEFLRVARTKLHLKPSDASDVALKALWCVLDVDDSNTILPNEMSVFLKLAPTETSGGFDARHRAEVLAAKAAAWEAAQAPDTARIDYSTTPRLPQPCALRSKSAACPCPPVTS